MQMTREQTPTPQRTSSLMLTLFGFVIGYAGLWFQCTPPKSVTGLHYAAKGYHWQMSRLEAVYRLGQQGKEAQSALPTLLRLSHSHDLDLQRGAIYTLGKLGKQAKTALPILWHILTHEQTELHPDAKAAIQKIDPAFLQKQKQTPNKSESWLTKLKKESFTTMEPQISISKKAESTKKLSNKPQKLTLKEAKTLQKQLRSKSAEDWTQALTELTKRGQWATPLIPDLILLFNAVQNKRKRLSQVKFNTRFKWMLRDPSIRIVRLFEDLGTHAKTAKPALLSFLESRRVQLFTCPTSRATSRPTSRPNASASKRNTPLYSPRKPIVTGILRALSRIAPNDPVIAKRLAQHALSCISSVKVAALKALKNYPNALSQVGKTLKQALATSTPSERRLIAYTLAHLGDATKHTLDLLLQQLRHKAPEVQAQAASALKKVGHSRIHNFFNLLSAKDWHTKHLSVDILGAFPSQKILPILQKKLQQKEDNQLTWHFLLAAKLGPKALPLIPALKKWTQGQNKNLQRWAFHVLAQIGMPAHKTLEHYAHHTNPQLRILALQAISESASPHPKALRLFLKALKSPHHGLQEQSLQHIAALGVAAKPALPQLYAKAQDTNLTIAKAARKAIWKAHPSQ